MKVRAGNLGSRAGGRKKESVVEAISKRQWASGVWCRMILKDR